MDIDSHFSHCETYTLHTPLEGNYPTRSDAIFRTAILFRERFSERVDMRMGKHRKQDSPIVYSPKYTTSRRNPAPASTPESWRQVFDQCFYPLIRKYTWTQHYSMTSLALPWGAQHSENLQLNMITVDEFLNEFGGYTTFGGGWRTRYTVPTHCPKLHMTARAVSFYSL